MTISLELNDDLEARLQAKARSRGLSLSEYLLVSLRELARPDTPEPTRMTVEERRARVSAARGFLAGLPGSVDEFIREKREEIAIRSATTRMHDAWRK